MYAPVATPLRKTPHTRHAIRAAIACGACTCPRTTFIVRPTSTTLLTVPIPGRWRSGIQSSSTATPTMIAHVPIARPNVRDRPWWKTSHGIEPEVRENEQRRADAVEDEAGVQLSETHEHSPNVHSRDVHGDDARRPTRRGRGGALPPLRPHRHPVRRGFGHVSEHAGPARSPAPPARRARADRARRRGDGRARLRDRDAPGDRGRTRSRRSRSSPTSTPRAR